MALISLTLDALRDLDNGKINAAFQHELKRAVEDCLDRPGDANARHVSLSAAITPVISDDGTCDGATVQFTIKGKVPDRKSKPYSFGVKKNGHLYFSEESPDNVDQFTFGDVDPETGRAVRNEHK